MTSKKSKDLLNKNISDYCVLISEKYKLDPKELFQEWEKMNLPKELIATEKSNEITIERVNDPSVNKDMLAAMCEAKGLKKTGKKDELILRLVEMLKKEKNGEISTNDKKKVLKKESVKSPIIESIKKNIECFPIKKNVFGNFEHLETHLVFTSVNNENVVTCVQKEDGTLCELSPKDLDLCHKFKFKYVLPKNLNAFKSIEESKLEDVDDLDLDVDDADINEPDLDDEDIEDEL